MMEEALIADVGRDVEDEGRKLVCTRFGLLYLAEEVLTGIDGALVGPAEVWDIG